VQKEEIFTRRSLQSKINELKKKAKDKIKIISKNEAIKINKTSETNTRIQS